MHSGWALRLRSSLDGLTPTLTLTHCGFAVALMIHPLAEELNGRLCSVDLALRHVHVVHEDGADLTDHGMGEVERGGGWDRKGQN